jgi:uncharacterized protein with NAD-binding domain and iron-sulfur cluster
MPVEPFPEPPARRRRAARSRKTVSAQAKVRVAIVGGGCAGLAAAWHLSSQPGYQVDVYEKSWRLGGKGASGRDDEGRILEHGLHVWLGFYENAFRMMRECYAEVERNHWGPTAAAGNRLAHGSLDAAFFPEPNIGVLIPDPKEESSLDPCKKWAVWSGFLPPAKGMPGDELDRETNPFTLNNYLLRCYDLIKTLMLSVVGPPDGPVPGQPGPQDRSRIDAAIEMDFAFDPSRDPKELVEWVAGLLRGSLLTVAAVLLQAMYFLEEVLKKLKSTPLVADQVFQLATAIVVQTRKLLSDAVAIDPELRHKTEILDIVMTIAVGLFNDRVMFEKGGFDTINEIDYREWLGQHGATPSAIQSQFIQGFYDLTFAYKDGKTPQLAAGVALRGALRMFFTYRGSMFWRMRSGMGDAVFAPLYKVLLQRGVKFHFLHSARQAEFSFGEGERYVRSLTFETPGDPAAFDALGDQALDHFGCWPDRPRLFSGAMTGTPKTRTKRRVGTDFDAVVFATGILDFVKIGERSQFFDNMSQQWRDMREHVHTVATRSAQAWLTPDLQRLGWYRGSGIMTAFAAPFETWADMTHILSTETQWRSSKPLACPTADTARTVAYFCGVLADADIPATQNQANAKVMGDLKMLLEHGMRPLWPEAFADGATAWTVLAGKAHAQANVLGSDRYTLSLPHTIKYRISPLDRSVMNMTIAGDWTANGLDAGCVEAAVMSGMLASFAITNDQPPLESIIGFHHP